MRSGHAAFYGPKNDIQVTTTAGAEETLSTVQLDFVQPGRLGLSYVASNERTRNARDLWVQSQPDPKSAGNTFMKASTAWISPS
jgi:hypothetical protein